MNIPCAAAAAARLMMLAGGGDQDEGFLWRFYTWWKGRAVMLAHVTVGTLAVLLVANSLWSLTLGEGLQSLLMGLVCSLLLWIDSLALLS